MDTATNFIVALTALIVAIAGMLKVWYDVRQVHKAVNGRLDELLAVSKAASRAEGKIEGKLEERLKNAKPAQMPPERGHGSEQ